jgi:hypothetical protein
VETSNGTVFAELAFQCPEDRAVYSKMLVPTHKIEPYSSVGITTGYRLDGLGTESRWGARFSVPVQTGPEAHPDSCTMGTESFPGVKNGRGLKLTLHPLPVP